MKLGHLDMEAIRDLASRRNVKSVAVENFLMTLTPETLPCARDNLLLDANLYKWNAATIKAIRDGIRMAEGR